MAETKLDRTKVATQTVLVLGGGAPNSTLMAGALCAFEEKKVKFDIVYTSGAGALMGLLYVAPNGSGPCEALRGTVELMGVSDSIYRFFPVGYKTFFKPGPFTRPLHRWGKMFKLGQFPPRLWSGYLGRREDIVKRWYNAWNELWLHNQGSAFQRLYNDLIDLGLAAINPSDLNPFSKGMCASFPFLEEMVDFAKLELFPGQFYMNAYNITDQLMAIFNKREIAQNPEIFRAALAMPHIYPPVEVDGKLYIEGADHDPISFGNLKTRSDNDYVKTIVVFDILSTLDDYIVREPRNLWDAYQISIMAPIVSLAGKNMEDFKKWVVAENAERKVKYNKDDPKLDPHTALSAYILNFEIPKAQQDYLLDWSYSNLLSNWRIGYKTGLEFVDHLGHTLPRRTEIEELPKQGEEERLRRRFQRVSVE